MKVNFFPKSSGITAIKCNHRHGAVMTFSHQTDSRFLSSIYPAELYGFKYNVRLGCFTNNLLSAQYNVGIGSAERTGLMRHDIYLSTDQWVNPITGVVETIPDYNATKYSEAGADYFNVAAGQSKTTRTPNVGQQMYDLSAGNLGYDLANSQIGASNLSEYYGIIQKQQEFLLNEVWRYVTSASLRNGVRNAVELSYPYFLGMRNSSAGDYQAFTQADTWYGQGLGYTATSLSFRDYFISYPSSTRIWDYFMTYPVKDKQKALDYFVQVLNWSLVTNGWVRDFCHWHSMFDTNTLPFFNELLGLFRSTVGSNFVHTCSNGEALEYAYVRELCRRVVVKEVNGKLAVIAEVNDKFRGELKGIITDTPMNSLNTPLSVEIDLAGTILAGKNVRSSYGKIINKGSNKVIVEIPYLGSDFMAIELSEGDNGYYTTTVPTATVNKSGGKLSIVANMPVRVALFSGSSGAEEHTFTLDNRSNTLSNEHQFDAVAGRDYKVGVISEFGQANLITV